MTLSLNNCPVCKSSNLNATVIGQNETTAICNGCGTIFELKVTGSVKTTKKAGNDEER